MSDMKAKAFYDGNGQLRMAVPEEDHLAEVQRMATKVAALEAENGRLRAPVSEKEKTVATKAFNKERDRVWEDSFTFGSIEESVYAALKDFVAVRAQPPSPAQDKVID